MNNFLIDITDKNNPESIPIIGAVTLSTGDGLETTQRYRYDYSRRPIGLVYRRRNTALNATIQAVFNAHLCLSNGVDMMRYISQCEALAGRRIRLVWDGKTMGEYIVVSVQIAGPIDIMDIFSQVQISFSLTEGYVRRETIEYVRRETIESAVSMI
jgi:hypothetical protein